MAMTDESRSLQPSACMPKSGSTLCRLASLCCLLLVSGVVAAAETKVAVVVLPPGLVAQSGDKVTAAAELACDQLARELAKAPSLRVVDRSQLDRILKERRIGASDPATIVSYDAMIRLEIDTVRPFPQIRFSVIDLSNGNQIVESQYPWSAPLGDDVIAKMVRQCQEKLPGLAQPGPKLLRVRLLEVENASKSARLEPLAGRLRETFDNALQRSKGVLLVHHLEAQTAKEEALLLTMGLSQLPGGRQFVPQSDATIELRIREMDGVGKTFDQTQVEVAWRVRKGQQYVGDWATTAGKVNDFDSLLKTAWARCAETLGQASPQAANDYLNEMALRRKQAQAELDAYDKRVDVSKEVALQRLAHCAAAVKLDPAWEEAAYRLVFANVYDWHDKACYQAGIQEALRYIQRFETDRKRRTTVAYKAFFWARSRFLQLRDFEKVELTSQDRLALDALKEIIDTFVAGSPDELPPDLPQAMHFVYRGMTLTGVDVAERHRWMDQVVRKGGRNVSLATHSPEVHEKTVLETRMWFRMHAVRLLAEEGEFQAARPYVEELIPLLSARNSDAARYVTEQVSPCVEKMNDPDLKARLAAASGTTLFVRRIDWLNFHPLGMMPPTGPRPRAEVKAIDHDKLMGASPLAACGGRMYCVVPGERPKDKPLAAFVEMDSQGRPAGKITLLSKQPAEWPRAILSTAVCKNRLYLGTQGTGLLEYDSAKNIWRTFGPEQGLPDWNVYTVLALDDGTLFCQGGDGLDQGFFCKVNPSTSEIQLLRCFDNKNSYCFGAYGLKPVWRSEDRITGFRGGADLLTLPKLGADEMVGKRWPSPEASGEYYESLPDGMAVIAGRRFLMCRDALREVDDNGKVLRTWPQPQYETITPGPKDLPGQSVFVPSDQPDLVFGYDYRCVAQDSSHIFFFDCAILCFDPANDTWYGPLETEPWTDCSTWAVSGRNGVWFNDGNQQLIYLDTAGFIAAAKKAGRVVTSAQFRQKQEESIRNSPPLDQAKWALCLKQYAKARDLCGALLEKDPRNIELLLMMALLHESCCLNQPDKAMEYYERLAAIEGNPSAAFTGLVHQYRIHINDKRYAEALRVGKLIQERYPRNTCSEVINRHNQWLVQKTQETQGGAK